MDSGEPFGPWNVLKFNGHFFRDAEALPLERGDIEVLLDAAESNWQHVEPTIFGTLLTRALDPKERHRLGAEYTPREYVERVVRQTVDVPLRERWAPVQAHVAELTATGKKKDRTAALRELRAFHAQLRGLRFLDPACGSGNFLYVTLHMVKRLELEVLRAIEKITSQPELGIEEVGPWQFHGIEIKPWAREIAELTLWIGYHQFWMEHHKGVNPPEPVLKDTGTLELRDAVLAWDEIVELPEKSRPDPTPRIGHPVTGKLVPDPSARLSYYEYRGARQARWPQADFIFGNPPYLGRWRQRDEFGDGYVDALRSVYPGVPDNADYVMYWWYKAAQLIANGKTERAGLITTNTIVQPQQRVVLEAAAAEGASVVWAIPDHPWVDETDSAAVRVTLTVISRPFGRATLVSVNDRGEIVREIAGPRMNPDLTVHTNLVSATSVPLKANAALTSNGFNLVGTGFVLSSTEGARLVAADPSLARVTRRFITAKEVTTARPRGSYVIDFGFFSEEEARAYPVAFDIVRTRVKPFRDANRRATRAKYWWRFGEPSRRFRDLTVGLTRYIATPYVSKHRFFIFMPADMGPDDGLRTIGSDSPLHLGVLSSQIHTLWALATGGTLEDRPRYNQSVCFDPFPFPDPPKHLRDRIGLMAEALDQHRKDAIARDERVTMTGMYNVVEKLRSGEKLTDKERAIHEIAACGTLLDLHAELDRLVAEAYGWPWPMEREEILERLVALHDERVEEEKHGVVRWLRPEYQIPRFGGAAVGEEPALDLPEPLSAEAAPAEKQLWPAGAIEQIATVKARVTGAALTAVEVASELAAAPVPLVARHLETLAMVGEVRRLEGERYEAVAEPV